MANYQIPRRVKISPSVKVNMMYLRRGKERHYMLISHNNNQTNEFYANQLTIDLLEATKAVSSAKQIIQTLESQYKNNEITTQLQYLLSIQIIIDADYVFSDSYANFWLDLGVSPNYAARKLAINPIKIINHSDLDNTQDLLNDLFTEVGIKINSAKPKLVVVVVDDYLQADIVEINQNMRAQNQKWLLLNIRGVLPLLGPVFNGIGYDFCYQCLAKRIRHNRQVHHTLSRFQPGAEVLISNFHPPEAMRSIAYQFCLEIARYIVLGKSDIEQHIRAFDWYKNQTTRHKVSKINNCPSCGQALAKTIKPFVFDKPVHSILTSGGYKSHTPEQTLAKYQYLVSPISGVVSHLHLVSKPDDDWSFVYESGNNIALSADNINIALSSVRMLNAGKGKTKQQAKVSALAESIERYCAAYQGDEISKQAKFVDFDKGEAILPNVFMHYSQSQYQDANSVNSKASVFHHVPNKIDINQSYDWSPIWSMLDNKLVWVPTQLLYFGYPYGDNWIASADTNGTASGNTKIEAFIQAFLELVERDTIAIWWHNRLQFKSVDLNSFKDEHIRSATKIHQQRYNRKLWALDVTSDIGVPTFVVVSYIQTTTENQDICFASASHFDAEIAMLRAVCEHTQLLEMINHNKRGQSYEKLSAEFTNWLKNANMANNYFDYLKPNAEKMSLASDYQPLTDTSLIAQKELCLDLVKDNNWQIYVSELTRLDIGMPVIKVLIPELRSMHTRLGEGRLYQAPVKMGKLAKPLTEKTLNKVAIFI